ncbi:MAG: hypothetical protein HKN40_05935 [Winogradskyella sp.]|uniref:hypothetical protein n=1 Tax=Winogradskyella sp. TaxID=1883156 RepID=UPI0017E292CA|nr:hypothetical protein [Winogradskyella sp.]
MNELSQFLVDSILKEDEDNLGTVALFGGGFKPPTRGHLEVVLQGLKENPEVKQVYILVGSGARNGVTQAEAVKIWEIYQKFIPVASQIIPVQSPFSFFKTYLTDHKDEKVYVFIGARPDNEEDDKDVAERSAYVKKYSENAIPVKVQTKGGVSGTMARKAALSGNNEEFISYFPSALSDEEKQEIIDMISSVVNEALFIKGKEVERIEKPTNNPEDAIVIYIDGTTEPYLDTVDEGRKKKKDPKKGTGKKPEGSGRRLYTDEDPKDTVGVSFRTKEDIVDTLNKKSFKAKSHSRQSQVINLIHQRVRAAYGRAKDPETKARLKRGLDYIKKRKEASKAKTKRLQAQKENVVPNHDGKSSPFGSGYEELSEGRYDSISRQLASIALNAWKGDFKDGASYGYFAGKITPEEYPTDLTFTFKALGRFVDSEYTHNGYSKSDGEVGVKYEIPKDAIPQIWEEVYMDLISTIRHEIEHQTQGGKNVKKGKGMASDQKLRQLIKKGGGDIVRYVTLPKEIESNVQGLYLKAKKWRRPYDEVVDEYIKDFLKITNPADVSYVKNKWQKIANERNLPSLLNENASYSSDIDYKSLIKELTKYMIGNGWNIQPLPKVVFKHGDTENARDFFGKTAYYDPNTQTIVLYTEGRHPKDIVRSFSHEMVHHEQNLEGRLDNIYTTNTQEDDRLNDIEKEANLNGTMTFRNWTDSITEEKKNKDPFGLNQFARELMTEGAYDALTTKLTKATINKWVEDSKQKPIPKKSFVDIDIDEFDGKGREIEFNYVGIVEFDKKIDGYEVDGTSNSGEDEGKIPFVATMFRINPKILPQAWSKISADVSDVIRHEIEHLTQAGDNVRGQVYDDEGNLIDKGKYMDDDIMIRDMINKLKVLPKSDYYKLEKEVDAMLQGLYLKAKKTRKPFADVVDQYLDIAPGIDTKEDKEAILNLWRSRRKALSLPVFETETGEMPTETSKLFKIFLDMDGVIVDFDKRFEDQFGMPPREFENNFGKDKFWEKIDSKGVGFWRGMDWMPGGQQLYNRVAKHDHALLSSPSRSDLSKIGKRMWRKDNTPNTKLILARSYNKKNYADKSNILIDDRADNIQQWKDAGGIGILYQSAEQAMKELDKLGL